MQLRPTRARERPLVLGAFNESVEVPNLEQDGRGSLPTVVHSFEVTIEKTLLERYAITRVEVGPVLETVDLQPFVS